MNVDAPQTLMIFLIITTLLGIVIGYCIGLIRAKRRAHTVIDGFRTRVNQGKAATEAELKAVRRNAIVMQQSLDEANERTAAALKREEALDMHSRLQAQRIQMLESQVASYEDQQLKLQRDFASYKSNKSRELELARVGSESWSLADQLPVLNKRIDDELLKEGDDTQSFDLDEMAAGAAAHWRGGERKLSIPLSRELDIPTLSESELPDSVDELEFEMADLDSDEGWPRG